MNNIFNPELLKIKSYVAPVRKKGLIRLDSMEHPFNLSNNLITQIKQKFNQIEFNRYPDSNLIELKEKLKQEFLIKNDFDLIFGNGSDELIQMLILATDKNRPVFSFNPSFSMYELLSQVLGREFIQVDLNPNFQINTKQTLEFIKTKKPSLIFIAEPNNPTGISFHQEDIEKICKLSQEINGLVVLDEAYFAFCRKKTNLLHFLSHYPNVVILRTLSKMGLASLRFGFMIGSKSMINAISPIRLPYNINSFNQILVDLFIDNFAEIKKEIVQVCEFRDEMFTAINKNKKIKTHPSDTNFLLIQANNLSSAELFEQLLKKNISVKDLKNIHPLLKNYIRVSMGQKDENHKFIDALNEIVS